MIGIWCTRRTRRKGPPDARILAPDSLQYSDFYDAMPDKHGEVWAGEMHGRDIVRFDPRTERWRVYEMPEQFAHDRRTWIDNSTDPISLWYIDSSGGYFVRIHPLE